MIRRKGNRLVRAGLSKATLDVLRRLDEQNRTIADMKFIERPSRKGQKQHRPATRAPHGCPEFTELIAIYCTPRQKKEFARRGGSA